MTSQDHAALSQQPEPTDTYTAVDMAAAQGFRDGQAAVEQATAQDERETIIVNLQRECARLGALTNELEQRLATRPAQTEQQPVAFRECRVISFRPGMGDVTFYVKGGVPGFMDPGCTIYVSDAAPIAQTAPQPEQSGLVEALKPFAAIADQYDAAEDNSHQVLVDAISEPSVRITLGQCRNARAALSAQGESHE